MCACFSLFLHVFAFFLYVFLHFLCVFLHFFVRLFVFFVRVFALLVRVLPHLVYVGGALREDGADGGRQAQLHQTLQLSLRICLRLVSGLLQRAAVYQSETPAAPHTNAHAHAHKDALYTCQQ